MNQGNIKIDRDIFILRHDLGPALSLPIIVLLCLIFGAVASGNWQSIIPVVIPFSFLCLIFVWFQLSYRIWWKDGTIFQKTSGGDITTIKADEIKQISQERSNTQALFAMNRPFRRIAIYGESSEGPKIIDVSLKHFNPEDIRKLMTTIHELRPDLEMPKGWV